MLPVYYRDPSQLACKLDEPVHGQRSTEEIDQMLRAGNIPSVFEDGHLVTLWTPAFLQEQHLDDYRNRLLYHVSNGEWTIDYFYGLQQHPTREAAESYSAKVLMWGYKVLLLEHQACEALRSLAVDARNASKELAVLYVSIDCDMRRINGVPLSVVFEDNRLRFDASGEAIRKALGRLRAADSVTESVFHLVRPALEDVLGQDALQTPSTGEEWSQRLAKLPVEHIKRLAHRFLRLADNTDYVVSHGIMGAVRAMREGTSGRTPANVDAWLVYEGRNREPKIGPQKLAKLLIAHGLGGSDPDVGQIKRRLEKTAQRNPGPIPHLLRRSPRLPDPT